MRIKATDPEASSIAMVRVDGKRVLMPFEFDTEEGWCDAYVPKTFGGVQYNSKAASTGNKFDSPPDFRYEMIRLHGKVEVLFESKTNE
jgi:hypothetical protein